MLTGRRPFEGRSLVDVLYAVLHQIPLLLAGRAKLKLRTALFAGPWPNGSRIVTPPRAKCCWPWNLFLSPTAPLLLREPEPSLVSSSCLFARLKVTSRLSAMDNLIVRSTLLAATSGVQPDPKRVAVEADVDAFLTGSLLRARDRFRLTCQLIEAPSGSVLWSESANSSMQDLFMIQDELCERALRSLQLPLDERERRSSHRDVPASARAYEYYLRANQIALTRTLDDMSLARDLYLQCLEESPNYAPAWVRLGRDCHFVGKFGDDADGNVERSEQAFNRAFALNPDLAIAHNFYTPTECDQGHTQKAMLRLLERARSQRNDAELFAGLVQACRYCHLLFVRFVSVMLSGAEEVSCRKPGHLLSHVRADSGRVSVMHSAINPGVEHFRQCV